MPMLFWTSHGPVMVKESRIRPFSAPHRSPQPLLHHNLQSTKARLVASKPGPQEIKRMPYKQRKAARKAQLSARSSRTTAKTCASENPEAETRGQFWDYRLGRVVWDAKHVRKYREETYKATAHWVVYILADARVSGFIDLAERIASALSRANDCIVHVNGAMPPELCARCVAVDANRAQRCEEHGRTAVNSRSTATKYSTRGAFDVYAMRCGIPLCWPPCLACGCPDGHAREIDVFIGGNRQRHAPPNLYRLFSRFANKGHLPKPAIVRKRLRRVARYDEAGLNVLHDANIQDTSDLTHLDQLLHSLEIDSMSPELAREVAQMFASIRWRGQCTLGHHHTAAAPATTCDAPALTGTTSSQLTVNYVEAPLPSPNVDAQDEVPEASPPASMPTKAKGSHEMLATRFVSLRSELRQCVAFLDDHEPHAMKRLRCLVDAWDATGFAAEDVAVTDARKKLSSLRNDCNDHAQTSSSSWTDLFKLDRPDSHRCRGASRATSLSRQIRQDNSHSNKDPSGEPLGAGVSDAGIVFRTILC